MAGRIDVQQAVTDRIIAAMEAGAPPWRKPWTGDAVGAGFPTRACGEAYRGINVMRRATRRATGSPTTRRRRSVVRKGEKSASVVKFGTFEKRGEKPGETPEEDARAIPFTKLYAVFNAAQIDGLPEEYYRSAEPPRDLGTEADPELKAFFAATGAVIVSTADPRAYYDPRSDRIHMPPIRTFHSMAGYYATLAHEAVHWSGAANRLDRLARFADRSAYAFEELIAELGNVMLCAELGLTPDFEQSAAYVESWLKALRDDRRAIFRAAAEAQKAVDYLRDLAGHAVERAVA